MGAVRDVIAMLDEYDLDMTAAEDPQLLVALCSTAHRDLSAAIGCGNGRDRKLRAQRAFFDHVDNCTDPACGDAGLDAVISSALAGSGQEG